MQPQPVRINLAGLRAPHAPLRNESASNVRSLSRLEVILKVAERCNINCSYCYFFDQRNQDYKLRPPVISLQTIEALERYLVEAVAQFGLTEVKIDFHGGEPLLMKKSRFARMCSVLVSRLQKLVDLRFSLQTNGILIDDEWIDIFDRYEIFVGVSLDGPRDIHDANRVDHKGRGTYERVVDGVRALQRRNLRFGVLTVLGNAGSAAITYQHLTHKLAIKNLHFLAPDETHDTANDLNASKVCDAVRSVYRAWLQHNDPTVRVRFLGRAIQRLLADPVDRVSLEAANRGFAAITVDSDGHVGPDDDLRNVLPHLFRGQFNVRDSSVAQFISSPQIQQLDSQIAQLPAICRTCCWKNVCQAGALLGAPVHRYSAAAAFDNPSVYCSSIQQLLEDICTTAVERGHAVERITRNLQ